MKRKLTLSIIIILALMFALSGCAPMAVAAHKNDPVAVSGNLDYYALMNNDTLMEKCAEQHIEVTGEVSRKVTSKMLYLGAEQDDRYYFSCIFSEDIAGYDALEIGDTVTLQGVCTGLYENIKLVNMYGCQLVHTHDFSAATCTEPKICSCGATEGAANGHSWEEATCTDPKACTVCGTTSGFAADHNFLNGKCTICEQSEIDYNSETMVWIPTDGGIKYHTHAGCSNMEDPEYVTQSEAESRGFTPCQKCY